MTEKELETRRTEAAIWRLAAFMFAGGFGGYVFDGPRGTLIGMAGGGVAGGTLWLLRL